METGQENAVKISEAVGKHRAIDQFEIERRAYQPLWHVEELFGERREFGHGQTAVAAVHRFGQRIGDFPARTRIMAVLSMPSFMAMASAVLNPMPRMSRARRYGFSDITCTASAP
jgi:hypothetical protein